MLQVAEHGLMLRLRALLGPIYSRTGGSVASARVGHSVGPDTMRALGIDATMPLPMVWDNFNVISGSDHVDQQGVNIAEVLCRRRHRKRRRQSGHGSSEEGARARMERTNAELEATSLGEIRHPYLPMVLRWQ